MVQIITGVLCITFGVVLLIYDLKNDYGFDHTALGIQGYGIWCGVYVSVYTLISCQYVIMNI